jgi:hypothetical protein
MMYCLFLITKHLNELNVNLQARDNLIMPLYFHVKLRLWESQIKMKVIKFWNMQIT